MTIAFPGAPSLPSVTQKVQLDGRINVPTLGQMKVEGETADELRSDLLKDFGPQLQIKEVTVTVSSTMTVYVTGAVLKPGKIISDTPITAFQAIMEAGGFDSTKAKETGVVLIRQVDGGGTRSYTLNLKLAFEGKDTTPVYLQNSDALYVPERFNPF